ncbi:MAG: radical SAM protein [Candidatus Omnitrophota bacterium]|nr:radical SAM protein [Candidatus Omnitrophota bacterium]
MFMVNSALFFLRLLKARLTHKFIPLVMQFNVTNNCNSRCSYCYAKYYEREHKDLDTKSVFYIIDELAKAGTQRLSLVGGEPLLRKDIGQIIDYIKSKGMECTMTTNGYFIPEKLKECKKLDLLCISLDGSEESHDANRGQGSFLKAMEAIRVACENHVSIQTSTVLTKNNLKDLAFLIDTAKTYNFYLTFTPMITQVCEGGKKAVDELLPSIQEYKAILRQIIQEKKKGAPILFASKVYEHSYNWKDFSNDKIMGETPDFKYIKCNAGRYSAIIDANADLYPCPQLVGVIKVKNILKVGLKEAWEYINNHNCKTCFSPCSNNLNLLLSLDAAVIYDLVKCYSGKKFKLNE